jgi:hypothetical protein
LNPYASPSANVPLAEDFGPESQIKELAAFVGPKKAAYYLKQWQPLLAGISKSTKVNWVAFFFAGFWMAYRKMYLHAAVLYGVLIVIGVAEFVIFDLGTGRPMPPFADRAVGIGVAAVCGIYANRWYLKHAQRRIAEVHAQVPEEARMQEIARRGGTNLILSIGFNVLALLLLAMAFAVMGIILGIVAPEAIEGLDVEVPADF